MATRWLNQEEQATWRAFLAATQRLMARLEHELQATSGLSFPHYEILVRLSEAPGHALRMSELAKSAFSSRSRMSHAASRLEAMGWLRREGCPEDRRGAFAVLTEEGYRVLAAAAPGHVEAVRTHLFDQLRPGQVQALHGICQAIKSHLDRIEDAERAPPTHGRRSPVADEGRSTAGGLSNSASS